MPYLIESLLHIEKCGSCFMYFVKIKGYIIYDVEKLGVIWPAASMFCQMIFMVEIFYMDSSNDSNTFAMELRKEIGL